ncbi:MAG TPA: CBS domain-containing protein [Burkholderiaceae bacterium]
MQRIADAMTRGAHTLTPNDKLTTAAQAMNEYDIGALPVCDGGRLVGMVTDRDLVVRGVAKGVVPDEAVVASVMSPDVCCCYEDEPVADAMDRMRREQIRRMPVVDREQHLVGMLALGDLATKHDDAGGTGQALRDISTPAEPAH